MTGYSYKYGKKLRKGFTTGTTAAAAAKASVCTLISGKAPRSVDVMLPIGEEYRLNIDETIFSGDSVTCYVKVDGGDDRNVLDGCRVYATARRTKEFAITAGEGIGTVTKRGLQVEAGKPAINPVPMKMIEKAIKEESGGQCVSVEISVENGAELAKRTLNEKLGIVGGISIIGTTGIVEPMSSQGYIDSMMTEIDMMLMESKNVVAVSGNYGYDYAKNILKMDEKKIVKLSNFIGDALFYLKNKDVGNILMVGHLGKFVKLAGGNFNTHSYVSDAKMEIIASGVIKVYKDIDAALKILECNTTDEACELLESRNMLGVFDYLCEKSLKKIAEVIKLGDIPVAIAYFNTEKKIVGKSRNFDEMAGVINA